MTKSTKKTSSNNKAKSKKQKKIRLQGYFTRPNLAIPIAHFIHYHANGPINRVIDPSGGTGYLLQGMLKATGNRNTPALHLVEPVAPDAGEKPYGAIKQWVGLFDMTLEEWCLTYAARGSYDLWLSNPPFNKRLGDTKLGEPCHPLFMPEIELFETLFLLTGSVVASRHMAFILPDGYFVKPEARPTLEKLAADDWDLTEVRALPLDGCFNSLENMSFLFFSRSEQVRDWIEPALDLITRHAAPPLFRGRETVTETGIHGPKTGYLLKGGSTSPESATGIDLRRHFHPSGFFTKPEGLTRFDWHPEPRAKGALWLRQGVMYALSDKGWEPANGSGYCDGLPVNTCFDKARWAYRLIQKGAFHAANRMLADLDLDVLRDQFKDIHGASFLMLVTKGPVVDQSFADDLKRLGMLEIQPEDEPEPIDETEIVRVHNHLVCRATLSEVQACELFLTYAEAPDWVSDRVVEILRGQHIPTDQLTLRTPWIPRPLIAQYLNCKLDRRGLYAGGPAGLMRYLNYGKDGSIIKDDDRPLFEVESNKFAVVINHWDSEEDADLRLRVHAHYRVANAPLSRVLKAYTPVEAANGHQLHPWQRDDLDFYLSGATLSNLDVGVGKTLTALAAAIAYTNGTPHKALIAVPKQVLMKWGRELDLFFPGVGYHILGFYTSKTGKTLRRPASTIIEEAREVFWNPSVQIILTSHQVLGDFRIRPEEAREADIRNGYDQLGVPSNTTQALAHAAFVKRSAERNYLNGGELTWSDLPDGMLVVIDEAHNYKNLFGMPSQGWGGSFIMAGSASESKRARDLQIKLDLVRQRGGKTIGLTATLVSNSVAEIYNMLRIYAPEALAKRGITNTQHVIDHFCQIDRILSVSLSGEIKDGQTIVGFKNLDVLRAIWQETTRTYTAADVGLKVPEIVEIKETITPTPEIEAFMDNWKDRLETVIRQDPLAKQIEEDEPSIFEIIAQLDKVAAHPPLVGIEGEHPKLDRLAANVLKIYHSPRHPGQQIVFTDMKAVQRAIRDRLIREGVPESEIVVVNADTAPEADQRLAIQDMFNNGVFRIVIGGRVISEGIDLQANTHCSHFVNLAWEGATLRQRMGRLVRQGNINAKVGIYYYLLDESTDIYRYLTIQRKTHWSEDLRSSQTNTLSRGIFSEDIDEDFLVALARNKDEIRAKLRQDRRDRELFSHLKTAQKTLRLMCTFARPDQRVAGIDILRSYEAKIRALEWIPAQLIDEGIRRVQQLVTMQYTRYQVRRRELDWERFVANLEPLQTDTYAYHRMADLFRIEIGEDQALRFHTEMKDVIKPEILAMLPDFPPTFGATDHAGVKDTVSDASIVLDAEDQCEAEPVILQASTQDLKASEPIKPIEIHQIGDDRKDRAESNQATQLPLAFMLTYRDIDWKTHDWPDPANVVQGLLFPTE